RAASLMEAYWMGVRLYTNHALPVNRGWLSTFRRWARTERFFDIWPVIAGTYNREFVQFCNRALNLPDVLARVVPGREFMTRDPATVRQHLVAEYAREWAERFMTFDRDARRYRPP